METSKLITSSGGGDAAPPETGYGGTDDSSNKNVFASSAAAVVVEHDDHHPADHDHEETTEDKLAAINETRRKEQRALTYAMVFCLVFMVVELVGGYLSHSLAILTDALHLMTDVGAYALSIFSLIAAMQLANHKYSYGWHRAEVLGTLASVFTIWALAGAICLEAVRRIYTIYQCANLASSSHAPSSPLSAPPSPSSPPRKGAHGRLQAASSPVSTSAENGSSATSPASLSPLVDCVPIDAQLMIVIGILGMLVNIGCACILYFGGSHGHTHFGGGKCSGGDHHGHSHGGDEQHHGHSHGGDAGDDDDNHHGHSHGNDHDGCGGHHGHSHSGHGHGEGAEHDDEDPDMNKSAGSYVVEEEEEGECEHDGDGHSHRAGILRGGGSGGTTGTAATPADMMSRSPVKRVKFLHSPSLASHGEVQSTRGELDMEAIEEEEDFDEEDADDDDDDEDDEDRHGHSHGGSSGGGEGSDDRHPHEHGGDDHDHSHGKKKKKSGFAIHAAFLHALGDCVQSLGVIIAGLFIYFSNLVTLGTPSSATSIYNLADPLSSILFAIVTLRMTKSLTFDILAILMESTPDSVDYPKLARALSKIDGVQSVHDLHVWSLASDYTACSVHLVANNHVDVLYHAQRICQKKFHINHITIQVDPVDQGSDRCQHSCGAVPVTYTDNSSFHLLT